MKNYTEAIMCLFRSTKHTRNYLLFPDKKIRRGYQLARQIKMFITLLIAQMILVVTNK